MLCGAHHHPLPPAASLIWQAREILTSAPPACFVRCEPLLATPDGFGCGPQGRGRGAKLASDP